MWNAQIYISSFLAVRYISLSNLLTAVQLQPYVAARPPDLWAYLRPACIKLGVGTMVVTI